jgi:hypothetical protein
MATGYGYARQGATATGYGYAKGLRQGYAKGYARGYGYRLAVVEDATNDRCFRRDER